MSCHGIVTEGRGSLFGVQDRVRLAFNICSTACPEATHRGPPKPSCLHLIIFHWRTFWPDAYSSELFSLGSSHVNEMSGREPNKEVTKGQGGEPRYH